MQTTYHLKSAQDLNSDIIESIKAAYKSKSIKITIESETSNYELNDDFKAILDARLQEDDASYITAEKSINELKDKYEL